MHCSSNGSTANERSDDKNILKSKLSDQLDLVINTQSQSLLKDPDEGQDNISLDNLVSDDDSFMLKATQAIETKYNDSDKQCSFQKQLPFSRKVPPKSKDILAQSSSDIITEKTIHKTEEFKFFLSNFKRLNNFIKTNELPEGSQIYLDQSLFESSEEKEIYDNSQNLDINLKKYFTAL